MTAVSMAGALFAGLVLGSVYFGGLWLTVRRLSASRAPALWLILSFVLRMSVLLAGIWLVAGGAWERWLSAVAGVIISRTLLVYRMQTAPNFGEQAGI